MIVITQVYHLALAVAVVGWFPPNQLVMLGLTLCCTAPALLICPSGPRHAATSLNTQRHSRAAHEHSRKIKFRNHGEGPYYRLFRLLLVNIQEAIKTHC